MSRSRQYFRIGEVARRTGLTVRTLHHYDAIGLLRPSRHTAAGHRLYGPHDLERLEMILLYRRMGISLDDIRHALETHGAGLRELLVRQLQQLESVIPEFRRQADFLGHIVARLDSGEVLTADDLLQTIEVTAMIEKHYTREQRERLEARRNAIGQDEIDRVAREWERLFAGLDEARRAGVPADDPSHTGRLAKADELIAAFTGGGVDIEASLERMLQAEGSDMFRQWGISEELGRYWMKVQAARRN